MLHEKLRIIHIEDEPEARKLLSSIVMKYLSDKVEYIRSAPTLNEGRELIKNTAFDLLFLDLQLVNENGMTLINEFPFIASKTILCTADDSMGIAAVNSGVFYYILKPIDIQETITVITKYSTENKLFIESKEENKSSEIGMLKDKIIIKDRNGSEFISHNQIVYLEADQNYTKVQLIDTKEQILVSKTLKSFEDALLDKFIRISRSHLINIDFIKRVNKVDGGSVELLNGITLPISGSGKDALKAFF